MSSTKVPVHVHEGDSPNQWIIVVFAELPPNSHLRQLSRRQKAYLRQHIARRAQTVIDVARNIHAGYNSEPNGNGFNHDLYDLDDVAMVGTVYRLPNNITPANYNRKFRALKNVFSSPILLPRSLSRSKGRRKRSPPSAPGRSPRSRSSSSRSSSSGSP